MITMNLTDNEVTLIKVLRLVKSDERIHVSIENRNDEMDLIFKYDDTFDFVSDEVQKESEQFISMLRVNYPNLISELVEIID